MFKVPPGPLFSISKKYHQGIRPIPVIPGFNQEPGYIRLYKNFLNDFLKLISSKKSEEYKVNTIQTDVISQLKQEWLETNAGQKIEYVITDFTRKTKRAIPLMMTQKSDYDVKRYAELLDQCYKTITQPIVDVETD